MELEVKVIYLYFKKGWTIREIAEFLRDELVLHQLGNKPAIEVAQKIIGTEYAQLQLIREKSLPIFINEKKEEYAPNKSLKKVPVVDLETKEVFGTVKIAAQRFGLSESSLSRMLNNLATNKTSLRLL